jgi:hypothetical protein
MRILLYMCPHTTIYVSSYCYICVLILLYGHTYSSIRTHMCKCGNILLHICVLILLYMCPHTTICVLIQLYLCPHTTIYLSSYYYIFVLILLYICPHTTIYLSSYYYTCVNTSRYVYEGMCKHFHVCVLICQRVTHMCKCSHISRM